MEYRNLGGTGVKVSPLCLGAMMFGRSTSEPDSIAIIERALAEGINFIDTANAYAQGDSERYVGKALAKAGKRGDVVLATKAFLPAGSDDPNARGLSRRHLIDACNASLRRLDTDWIDLYQLHRPQADIPIDETLRALDDLIRAGKVRYIGTSMFAGCSDRAFPLDGPRGLQRERSRQLGATEKKRSPTVNCQGPKAATKFWGEEAGGGRTISVVGTR